VDVPADTGVGVEVPELGVVLACGGSWTDGREAVMSVEAGEGSVGDVPPRSGERR